MAKRLFRIDTGIWGGELILGTVNEEFVQHFVGEDGSEIREYLMEAEDLEPDDLDGPEVRDEYYSWSEVDDIEHLNGPYANTAWTWQELPAGTEEGSRESLEENDEGESFDPYHLLDREAYHDDNEESKEKHTVKPVLVFHTAEKGGMGSWFVETDGEDFDPTLVAFSSVATNVAEIVESVWYNKEELEHNQEWSDTNHKGDEVQVGWMNMDWHDKRQDDDSDTMVERWEWFDEHVEESKVA